MNFWFMKTKIFALFILIFANLISTPAQVDSIYSLQAGTTLRLEMDNEINSRVASINDTFTATVAAPLLKRETTVLPVGTVVEGRITKVRRASFGGRGGVLEVSFQTIRLADGTKREIEGLLVNDLKANSSQTRNFLTIFGGTAIGGIVGAASRTNNGTLIGAGIGAGAGTGASLFRKGRDVRIKADEQFEIKLMRAVNLPVQDY